MAGSKLNRKIKGSTILEVIIAMVVIVVVFGIAMMIYSNVLRLSLSAKKLRAKAVLEDVLLKAAAGENQTLTIGEFRIEQEIQSYNGNNNLLSVHLTAYDANQLKIAELRQVMIKNP